MDMLFMIYMVHSSFQIKKLQTLLFAPAYHIVFFVRRDTRACQEINTPVCVVFPLLTAMLVVVSF